MARPTKSKPVYAPSPAEIRKACKELQADWNEREHRKRAGMSTEAIDVVAVDGHAMGLGSG